MAGVRSRAWWVAGGAVLTGGAVWAGLRFGVGAWLSDEGHPVRPVLEALSWVAGITGLVLAVATLVMAVRRDDQGRAAGSGQVGSAGGVTGGASRSVRNEISGSVHGMVVQADTITMNRSGPWNTATKLGVLGGALLVAAVVVIVVVQGEPDGRSPGSPTEQGLQTVVEVSSGSCSGGWVVPAVSGPVPLTEPGIRPDGAIQADQGLVVVTVQGSLPAAVVLQSMRAEVVSRRPATAGVLLATPCEGAVTPRRFGVDLTEENATPVGLPGRDGGETIPPPEFPFQVSEAEVEQFMITPNVSTDDVEWRLRITWTSGDRRGESVVDDNGRPFRTTGTTAATSHYCVDWGQEAWAPASSSSPCDQLESPVEAGYVGDWVGADGGLVVSAEGTGRWTTQRGEVTFRLLSIIGGRATADVIASDDREIPSGDRLTLVRHEDALTSVTQLGKSATWCRPDSTDQRCP